MNDRLSFYRKKQSPIHALNPFTKLTLTFTLIFIGVISPGYWTASIIFCLALMPLVILARLFWDYVRVALRLMVPTVGFIFIMQSIFIPGGTTEVFRAGPISIELETIYRAFLIASRIFLMISAFVLLLLSTHPSELMTDLTKRGLPPQFSYVLISTLQIIPQMQAKAQTIISAQRARGLDTESTFLRRAGSLVPLVAPLVFGSLVEVEERAIAIEARGFTSTHAKTSLHEIPDTRFDRNIRFALMAVAAATLVSRIWLS